MAQVSLADPGGIWPLNPEPDPLLGTPECWGCGLDKLGNPCGMRAPPAPLPRRTQRGAALPAWRLDFGVSCREEVSTPKIFVWLLEKSCHTSFFCFCGPSLVVFIWWVLGVETGPSSLCQASKRSIQPFCAVCCLDISPGRGS